MESRIHLCYLYRYAAPYFATVVGKLENQCGTKSVDTHVYQAEAGLWL